MNWTKIGDFFTELLASLGARLMGALIVLIVGIKLISWLKKRLKKFPKIQALEDGLESFLLSFVGVSLYAVLFVTVALMLGVPATSFLTILASCGVAVGLALQGALSNFAGGIMILIFKPFKVGDYISTPDASGTVKAITVVYTILDTPDNKAITIPNGVLTNSVVENYSAMDKRRVDLEFNVDYDTDVETVKALLLAIAAKHPLVVSEPEPMARLTKHGDSSLVFTMRVWCKTDDYWSVRFDLLESVKAAFDKMGIKIPFPQLDVHLNK